MALLWCEKRPFWWVERFCPGIKSWCASPSRPNLCATTPRNTNSCANPVASEQSRSLRAFLRVVPYRTGESSRLRPAFPSSSETGLVCSSRRFAGRQNHDRAGRQYSSAGHGQQILDDRHRPEFSRRQLVVSRSRSPGLGALRGAARFLDPDLG